MSTEQILLFTLIAAILGMLVWGRVRHDLIAAGGLFVAVVLGLVPERNAFSGFSNDAVIIVALALVVSRGLENSGALTLLATGVIDKGRSIGTHIAITAGLGSALSAIMNNVAALALLMPLDAEAARRAARPAGQTLMPLSFATILGGTLTLIGTPPNVIASSIRAERLGAPYEMFDFSPVGLVITIAGVLFVATVGWRLVPRREDKSLKLLNASTFKAELRVPASSPYIGKPTTALDSEAERSDVLFLGLIRDGHAYYRGASTTDIAENDILIIDGSADGLAAFIKSANLQELEKGNRSIGNFVAPEIVEAVVRSDSRLIGSSATDFELRKRYGVTLLGMEQAGVIRRTQVRDRIIEGGDVLLVTGKGVGDISTLSRLGLVPVDKVAVPRFKRRDSLVAVGLFAAAILATAAGALPFTVALGIVVGTYAALGIVPAREFYQQIEWPIVVTLAFLLPLGDAFDSLGGTHLIAQSIGAMTQLYSPVIALVTVMTATMLLCAVLNNVATIVIFAPVSIELAQRLSANPDTFLMGVTIAASCAFLTPLGHKNNMLIMGPGGFAFSDYWRLGAALTSFIWLVGIPALLIFWPL